MSGTLPLSHGQRALWLLHQLAPQSPSYNIALAVRVVSDVDAHALRTAFQALVDRYAVFRSAFPSDGGEPVRVVRSHLVVPFVEVDASGWSLERVYEELRSEIDRPFDLANGPIFRIRLLKRSAQECFLAFAVHHIAMDGWSLWLCLSDLRELYAAAARGTEPRLPKLGADFETYLRIQNNVCEGDEGLRHRAFWSDYLRDQGGALALPTDRVRPPVQTLRGASHRFTLSPPVTASLRGIARRVRGTLQMTILALFEVLLGRYSGQREFPIGYLASGRSRTDLEPVVGYLANPLTLRAHVRESATFADVLKTTRDTLLDVLEHQDYPFSAVVDLLAPPRDPSRPPLFQVLFVYEKPHLLTDQPLASFIIGEPGARMTLGDLVFESLPFSMQREGQYDLTLVVAEEGGGVSLSLDYNTDLFDASTIRRMGEHLHRLATAAATDAGRAVATLPMLTLEEQALVSRLAEPTTWTTDVCLHTLFEQHASRQPDAPAVAFEGAEQTYGQLNRRANVLARHLRDVGVSPDAIVGLCVERSPDAVRAMLGILKAGGAFLPLDPSYPEDRVAFMIADSRIRVLVTQRALVHRLPPFTGTVVVLEDTPSSFDDDNLSLELTPDNLAYVIYTSGSTGRPKGVALEHRGVVNVALEQQRMFGVGPGSRVLQFAALSFDASVFDFAMALGSGGTLCMARPPALLPGLPLLATMLEQRVTIATLPPSALLNMPQHDVPTLNTITVAGEPCPAELVARWAPRRSFFNLYGPTEATIWTTAARCEDGTRTPSIGGPIRNVQVHVLDSERQHVPVGVPGELYIGGVSLARGYLHQPELTRERFIANPFDAHAGSRLYRTGDLVRLTESGDLEFLGRIDQQIKLRGFRIELGEIETILGQHPGVNEAAVVVRGTSADRQRIVAYVVPMSPDVSEPALKGFLKARLPEFMLPASFVFMERFPLSPAGKVDRGALPAPDDARTRDDIRVLPAQGLEQEIAEVWKEVLGTDRIGAEDNFFDIGGTSLSIARVHARLNALKPPGLAIVEMFQFPTVRALAARLAETDPISRDSRRNRVEELAAGRSRLLNQARRRGRPAPAPPSD